MKVYDIRMDLQNNVLHVTFDSPNNVIAAQEAIMKLMASDPKIDMDTHIKNLCDGGNIINAIKYCRQETGWGLKESKQYVDKIRGYEPIEGFRA